MAVDMKKWKHDELLGDLAEYLCRPERMLWLDMAMENHGSCRPDAFSLNRSFTSPKPIAYEIKVSVSDYRSDITTGKWQKYLQYAGAVIFCVPKGLITKQDLPHGCGLMVRGDESWRTVKAPTIQKMPDLPAYTWMKLLMDGVEKEYKFSRLQRIHLFNTHKIAKQNFSEDVALAIKDIDLARNRIDHLNQRHKDLESKHKERLDGERDRVLGSLKSDREAMDAALHEFAKIFGFNPANSWRTRGQIELIYDRCQESKEIHRLEQVIVDLRVTLDKHLRGPMPEIDAEEIAILAASD